MGAVVTRPVTIEGISGSDIKSIVVIGGYNPKIAALLPDGTWSVVLEVYEIDSGIQVLRFLGKGADGANLKEVQLLLNIEVGSSGTNLPVVTIDEPPVNDKIYNTNQFTIYGTAGDAAGLEGVYFSLDGVNFGRTAGIVNGALTGNWTTNLTLVNGSNTAYVKAKNTIGVYSIVTQVNFSVDDTLHPADPYFYYYSSAYYKTGLTQKNALHEIIDRHTVFPYTSSATDVWDALKVLDEDPGNPANVLTIYTHQSISKSLQSLGGAAWTDWNREHTWPNSYGFNDKTDWPPYTDLFALRPEISGANTERSNEPYDNGGTPLYNTGNYLLYLTGVPTSLKEYLDSTWEPPDDMKGDIARAMFYMAVRYNGDLFNEPDLELVEDLGWLGSGFPYMGKLSTLIQWHLDDPPSPEEMLRNDLIYTLFQGNRNPFIDHPEWVTNIW
jgi:endonuclease I